MGWRQREEEREEEREAGREVERERLERPVRGAVGYQERQCRYVWRVARVYCF